jgi:hypothetical protein
LLFLKIVLLLLVTKDTQIGKQKQNKKKKQQKNSGFSAQQIQEKTHNRSGHPCINSILKQTKNIALKL